ncbi:UNVERIFIED_CONTAM: hypothetical protein Sradi_6296200 [Sesamum radiatum]|uniref:Uncharacterized protein n=1 Tax=Sesamum radiatum TaxID=300843 RepID=A0AAW2KDN3_SESRA
MGESSAGGTSAFSTDYSVLNIYRQAVLLERKKQKKLRQKEQKVKEQFYGSNENLNVDVEAVDGPTSTEASGPSSPSDCNSNSPDVPINLDASLESMQPQSKEPEDEIEAHSNISSEHINLGDSQTIEPQMVGANGHRALVTNRWHVSKSQRGSRYGFHVSPHLQTFKPETSHKTGPSKDRSLLNGSKVWTKKLKVDSDGESLKPPSLQGENGHQIEENKCEVIIGSISVALKNSVADQQDNRPDEAQDVSSTEHGMLKKKNASEKLIKANSAQSGSSRGVWRPVIHGEVRSVSPVERGNEDSAQSQSTDNDDFDNQKHYHVLPDENAQRGCLPFSSIAAKEFLAQRWKEAISSDHVKLVLSAGPEPPGCSDVQQDSSTISNVPELHECSNNQFGRNVQGKFSKKQEKSLKVKYRPKQKAVG